ncbi:MAG: outer membrane insertion C- signal [Cyclobacteriaceae bacterium]|nr:outer membrane insertion C- signal [Cyclobacteriaceae bacterium]
MKKIVSVFALAGLVFFASHNAQAQTEGYELGLRFGDYFAAGAGIDFAMPLSANRLHATADFNSVGVGVTALYDWQFPFAEGFMFYPGVGASVLIGDPFLLGITGDVGVEYQFPFPLTLGIDFRPTIPIVGDYSFRPGWGLNARWRF